MGAYSPAPVITPSVHARVLREIIIPTLRGMAADGIPYAGFLYAGLMIDPDGHAQVLEFNCRLGDPEAQPILMRLKSDLAQLILAAIDARLDRIEAQWDRRPALGVVLAAAGYPEAPRTGDLITGLRATTDDVHVFHAGTTRKGDALVTSGGRVLCVTALGETVRAAQASAYTVIKSINIDGVQFRTDIGHRAVHRP
jgi:phosphoribosylamine---glycine ligase